MHVYMLVVPLCASSKFWDATSGVTHTRTHIGWMRRCKSRVDMDNNWLSLFAHHLISPMEISSTERFGVFENVVINMLSLHHEGISFVHPSSGVQRLGQSMRRRSLWWNDTLWHLRLVFTWSPLFMFLIKMRNVLPLYLLGLPWWISSVLWLEVVWVISLHFSVSMYFILCWTPAVQIEMDKRGVKQM